MKPVYVWRYTLRSAKALNAASARTEHEGALIRVGEGFGCIHPWPELGDLPLEGQLRVLREGGSTLLIDGALECAEWDAQCREKGRSMFSGEIPESHWLVRPGDDPGFAAGDGFSLAKIKGTRDLRATLETMERWRKAGLRIRLDFNESLEPGGFLPFWKSLTDEQRSSVDFVEDPEQWTRHHWEELRGEGVPLAVDRDMEARLLPGDVAVMKPARPDWCLHADSRYLVTSYMDHAVGQVFAAAKASSHSKGESNLRLLPCGLLTHRCFDSDPFFERLRCDGPRLIPPGGTGLGFDDLLESLPWKRLT
jgi:O-succinylbenzoate synthase